MKLVIVESPTKAKTISNFLGDDFVIESSYGHVRDLPKSKLGIDIEKNFKPQYIIPKKSQKTVTRLKEELKKADTLILATDEDREGEAIAWHLTQALGLENSKSSRLMAGPRQRRWQIPNSKQIKNSKFKIPVERIAFHEITKNAIEEALKNPREIDINLVNAQQARRVLDRLVGYKLSPFLWKKLMRGLSAGRVQSVALRLIVDREKEIRAFKPEIYWTIVAILAREPGRTELLAQKKEAFEAILTKIDGKPIPLPGLKDKKEVEGIISDLKKAVFRIKEIESRAVERKPAPPFTTSTLQQTAWQFLRFSAKKTMLVSQQLYEGIDLKKEGSVGLITYMRTDSFNIAEEALKNAQLFLKESFGENYSLATPRRFKTKSRISQEAHEAVRPTNPARTPESIKADLTPDQYKLYKLIWQRFIATQMPNAIFEQTDIAIEASAKTNYLLRASGLVLKFDGFLKIYPSKIEEKILPEIKKDDKLTPKNIEAKEHQTEPPPRYTEASLIKALEKFGIGRPSTYAPIMSTIGERGYVTKDAQKKFVPSEIGEKVAELLAENFPKIVDVNFTANMENDLDDIAENKKDWVSVVKEFYVPFEKNLEEKYESVEKQNLTEETGQLCEKCGKPMVIRYGRFGKFIACSGFPECRNTKEIPPVPLDINCPLCKTGKIVERKTRRGRIFYGCSNWPKCAFATWQKPTGKLCPECNSAMVDIRGQEKCSNKNCIFKRGKKSKK
jgi:DNA topoisomerase-1